jgi:hypothetical protein
LSGIGSDSEDEEEKKEPEVGNLLNKVKGKGEETLAARMLRKANMLRKKNVTHNIRESGEQYRAKGRTQGDLNIPGRAAPHAFVQLNPMVEYL